MENNKEIIIKIDCDFLIEKRLKKIESIKFDNNFPDYFKKIFTKDCEEYIEILKSISNYTTTAKNLGFIIVFHKLWTNKEFNNELLINIFDNIIKDVVLNETDLSNYNTYKQNLDFQNISLIINKYKPVNDYVHTSIKDRVLYEKLYSEVYENAYTYFNDKLDFIIANIESDYENYKNNLSEGIEALSLEEFKKSITINASLLIEEYYKDLNI